MMGDTKLCVALILFPSYLNASIIYDFASKTKDSFQSFSKMGGVEELHTFRYHPKLLDYYKEMKAVQNRVERSK